MLGFDETYFVDDFLQKNLVREYVSDQEMFEKILSIQAEQVEGKPMFLFGVTMQNHGGYDYEGPNYEKTVSLEGYSKDYPDAEQYLTLIHGTDSAVEYLLESLKMSQRETIVVFYGDHQPSLDHAFYEELNGGALDTLDEQMLQYKVPFFIWANFDLDEKEIECSSLNYLPVYVLEAAGIPLPPYFQFLRDMESVIPAINPLGYYSKEKGGFIPLEEAEGKEAEAIEVYNILQYNGMFDEENRSEFFFGNVMSN